MVVIENSGMSQSKVVSERLAWMGLFVSLEEEVVHQEGVFEDH